MNILSRWFNRAVQVPPPVAFQPWEVRDAIGASPIRTQVGRAQWPKVDINAFDRDYYRKMALIFRCIGLISQSVANAPLRIYDVDDVIDKHPIDPLIARPNRYSSEARFISFITMTAATAGFCVIEKERSVGNQVIGLWPINPTWCRPIPRDQEAPDWEIRVPGYQPTILEAADAIVMTWADRIDNSPFGIGPVEVILREASTLSVMSDFLKGFFDQGAMPVYALIPNDDVVDQMTQAEADAIREAWRQRYGGLSHSVDPAVLAGIKDVKRLNFDFDELAYTDLRDVSELAICQAFGVPPILVGTRFGLERSTFANYGEARRSFYEDTIAPIWRRISDALTFDLLPDFDANTAHYFEFDLDDVAAMRDDTLPQQQFALSALTGGGITTHQFASMVGIEPLGEDVFLRSIATIEVPVSGVRPADEDRSVRPLSTAMSTANPFAIEQRRRMLGERNRTAYLKVAGKYEKRLRTFWKQQGERIVSDATRSRSELEIRDINDIDWTEEDRLLAQIIQQLQLAASELSFQIAGQTFPDNSPVWDLSNPKIQELIGQLGQRIKGITETTRTDVERIVLDSLDEGVSMDELGSRLTGLFEESYQSRAVTVSRTESMQAYNQGSVAAYRETGQVDRVMMLDNENHCGYGGDDDGLECCQRNGMVVGLDEAEASVLGTHPNCVLALSAVLIGEDA